MQRTSYVDIVKPEQMRERIEELGCTVPGFSALIGNVVSASTLRRMMRTGRASEESVRKILAASPSAGPYILFNDSRTEHRKVPKKIRKKVRKFAESVKPALDDGTVSMADIISCLVGELG